MTAYRCLAMAADGAKSWRTVEAADRNSAAALIAADRLIPIEIHSGRTTLAERLNRPVRLGGKLGLGEQSLILTQLATLLRAGLPVDRSLDLLRDQATRSGQRELLTQVVADVRAGKGLAAALEAQDCFPAYVIGVLRAAERGGGLHLAMASVAERITLASATRSQLVTTLSYPAAVLAASVLALGLVLTLVIPQLAPIFDGEEAKLPAITRLVLVLSEMTTAQPLVMLVATAVTVALPWLLIRSGILGRLSPQWRRRIPGLRLRDDYLSAQFMGVLGTLVDNGVTAVSALPLARSATGSARWQAILGDVERRVREGDRLSAALDRHDLLPSAAIRLIEVGERSGGLANACLQASAIVARSAKARIDRIVALANPIAIVTLGGIVGMLVGGVMIGIFSLGDLAG